jgi:hypothetical protein
MAKHESEIPVKTRSAVMIFADYFPVNPLALIVDTNDIDTDIGLRD